MKVLSKEQIKAWEAFTIQNETIASIDLMERASNACIKYFINKSSKKTISVDMPSGLYADVPNDSQDVIVKPDLVLTFQLPKLSFLMAQNQDYVPVFEILDIGLSPEFLNSQKTNYYFVSKK